MNNTGWGLCLARSSAEGETQSLQERRGGLDVDKEETVSLDDVSIRATENVQLSLEIAEGMSRVEGIMEEYYVEESENEAMTEVDELATQFRTSRQTSFNPSSGPVLSETSWICVLRARN